MEQLTAAEMFARAKEQAEAWAAIGRTPPPKPMNQHILWALAVAMGRMPMTSIENARYMYAGIRL